MMSDHGGDATCPICGADCRWAYSGDDFMRNRRTVACPTHGRISVLPDGRFELHPDAIAITGPFTERAAWGHEYAEAVRRMGQIRAKTATNDPR
jgi:hypothetical protein